MERTKLYSPLQVALATLVGGPLAATFLLKRNFEALGKTSSAKKTFIIGILYTLVCLAAALLLPRFASGLTAANAAAAWQIARSYQKTKDDIKSSDLYRFQSNWRVLGIIVGSVIVTFVLALPIAVVANPDARHEVMAAISSQSPSDDPDVGAPTLDDIKQSAEGGDAASQYELAMAYYGGETGLIEDKVEAVKWLNKAADQGYADAEYSLGAAYQEGEGGLTQSDKLAAEWWLKAAAHGSIDAQYNMGVAYRDGIGVDKNPVESKIWFQKAAEQGDEGAKEALREMPTAP